MTVTPTDLSSFVFHRITATPRPSANAGSPADDRYIDKKIGAKLFAAITAAHAELSALPALEQLSHPAATARPGIAVVWDRPPGHRQLRILVGGYPYFPPAHVDEIGPSGSDRPSRTVPVLYPPGSRGIPAATELLLAEWDSLPCWVRCTGRSDPLWAPGANPPAAVPARGGFEDYIEHVPGPFAWLVVAEPIPPEIVDRELLDLEVRLPRLRNRPNHEPDRIELARGEARFRELSRAKAAGMWQVHILVGSTSETATRRAAALLCSASDLDELPYLVRPGIRTGPLTEIWNTRITTPAAETAPPDRPGSEDAFGSPFPAAGELVVALARPPRTELPGIEVLEPPRFDVTAQSDTAQSAAVHIGGVLDGSDRLVDDFAASPATLNRHTFVAGATGAGKSQTVRHLLEELTVKAIPWLVIEPAKSEYAAMAGRVGDEGEVTVIRPGDPDAVPVGLNPLEPEPGFPLQTHIDLVRALFEASFDANEPFPQVLAHALTECYTNLGWDLVVSESRLANGVTPKYPSLADLQSTALTVVDRIGYSKEITDNVRGFIDVRLSSLRLGTPGRFFEGNYRLDVADLLARNVVLEIEDLGNDTDKAFFIGAILIRLYQHLRVRHRRPDESVRSGLRHITVIEEAHRLLKKAQPGTPAAHAVELFASLLAEIRAYGEGFVIAEQIPAKITPDVIKNTALKIVHRLPAGEDRDALGTTMNLTEDQSRHVVSLPPGHAAVFADGMDRPLRVRIPYNEDRESRAGVSHDIRIAPREHEHVVIPPMTMRDLARAQRLADEPRVIVWCELLLIAHLMGRPTPRPAATWIDDVVPTDHPDGRRILRAAIAHRLTTGIDARYRGLTGYYQPETLTAHLIRVAFAQMGLLPCIDDLACGNGTRCDTRWQAGDYRWADVRRALTDPDIPTDAPHPDTEAWIRRGLFLPGATPAEQLEALRTHPDLWASDPAIIDGPATTSTRTTLMAAIAQLSPDPDPKKQLDTATLHLTLPTLWPLALFKSAER
ncbi:helicase HerA-like domain-containing protein [Nocardia transvalensis]|uniref:helicase HerA-like domain-containing protein n=1 Tax=Nocardia transvalensis TaxID=37333 RepID=UPI001895AE4C|nr:ATP-binding protein [Nocardia transvalensis]MBF6332352.1 ATP-binding protein [Nocardia transvalensis]